MTTSPNPPPPGAVESVNAPLAYGLRAIPTSIWALGFVSMFMDISSEMIHSLLPVFLVSVLRASAVSVGLIEGIAEATASITKVFSGTLSDYLGRRKLLTAVGYGLAAFTKPLFPLAPSVAWVVAARFIDRVGKGIRGAPRDALVGDIAPPHLRGACYGLRQSLDTVGAFAGPLAATALMALLSNDFRAVFWIAVVPAFLSVTTLIFGVQEPEASRPLGEARSPIQAGNIMRLGAPYWWIVLIAVILTLARFSEAFLILRVQQIGLPFALVPLVLVVMNAVYAISAYPAGHLSDRIDRRLLLLVGFVVLIGSDMVLALATGVWQALAGVALWGLHMGLTQGLFAALVADTTPSELRGTAFGLFNLASGVAMLVASVLAGWLWHQYGPPATFYAGAGFTATALVSLMTLRRRSG
ncbi:MAG TPA: MFS transporter [Methylomirabilota bacterium]|nr:MFS transporter [Methylomirabilota bacterium]